MLVRKARNALDSCTAFATPNERFRVPDARDTLPLCRIMSIAELGPHQRYAFLFSHHTDKAAEDWNEHVSTLLTNAALAHVDEQSAREAISELEALATGRFAEERHLWERVFLARKSAVSNLSSMASLAGCGVDVED